MFSCFEEILPESTHLLLLYEVSKIIIDTDFQIFRVLQLEEIISVFHSRGIVCASLALPAPRELEQMLRCKKATADLL